METLRYVAFATGVVLFLICTFPIAYVYKMYKGIFPNWYNNIDIG